MEILVPVDPVARACKYLGGFGLGKVAGAVPDGWAWDGPLVVVKGAGGGGEYSRVLADERLTVEASAPARGEASLLARRTLALLRAWQDREGGVYWSGPVGAVTYWPDDETGTPLYQFTVALAFRAQRELIA